MADAKRAARERPETAGDRDLKALARDGAHCFRVHTRAYANRRDRHRARLGYVAEEAERTGLAPARDRGVHRIGQQAMACEHGVLAFAKDQRERGLQPGEQALRRRAAELAVREIAAAQPPVPVVARRGVAGRELEGRFVHRDEAQPRRHHQPLLARAEHDVGAQLVHRERRGTERGDHIDDEEGRVLRGVDRGAQRG